jgi:hypothetical protein
MSSRAGNSVIELDLVRGLAIALMVINHAGYRLLDAAGAQGGAAAPVVFAGSFAPVIFFFATGFGVALARAGAVGWSGFGSVLLKAALLLLADQFLFWKQGAAGGLDFLGFIALSTVAITALSTLRRATWWGFALLLAVLALRFVVGPLARSQLQGEPVLAWIVGAPGVPGISYPLSPWMAYPLMGFIAARLYVGSEVSRNAPRLASVLTAAAITGLLAAWGLGRAGMGFFRWGTMNFGYFVLSLGVLSLVLALAVALVPRWPTITRALSIRGVASLAAVPVHYGFIALAAAALAGPLSAAQYLMAALALVAASMASSKLFALGVERLVKAAPHPSAVAAPLGVAVLAAIAAVWWPGSGGVYALPVCIAAQLAIAALLAVRNRKKIPAHASAAQPVVS